jgi:protein ImuB
MLWIGLHFPRLPLETLQRGSLSPDICAVAERDHVLLPDRRASARGVHAGMLVSAALAMVPQLRALPRDPAGETENLLGLAAWAGQFTPSVSLEFPETLLLEISGSLRLFGGMDNILRDLRSGLKHLGYEASFSTAPTARAAAWLARAGTKRLVTTDDGLHGAIEPLPIALLQGPPDMRDGLAAIGVRTLGDVLALPRDGVARRFGQALLDQLDRALGRLAEPRSFFTPPARFHAALELPAEVTQAEALLFAGGRLLAQLSGYLAARSCGVQRFRFRFRHRDRAATEMVIGLVAPSRDPDHFTVLLRERLGTLSLREPVRSIALDAHQVVPFTGSNQSLLAQDRAAPGDWQKLLERLRARLGEPAVHALALTADHRPERASCIVEPGTRQMKLEFGERPFWLLEAPRALPEVAAVPHYEGPLTLVAGPERIESGWWDGDEAVRDYFIARTRDDGLLWVYRERGEPAGWYLHGVFS